MVRTVFCISLAAGAAACQSASPALAAPEIPPVIAAYFDHLATVYRAGSTQDDVEDLLELMTDDVRYVHVAYGAEFDLESWRAAFLHQQQSGRYTDPEDACLAVTNTIPGNRHYAVEYVAGRHSGGTCQPSDDPRQLVVFSVTNGKLARIEELW